MGIKAMAEKSQQKTVEEKEGRAFHQSLPTFLEKRIPSWNPKKGKKLFTDPPYEPF